MASSITSSLEWSEGGGRQQTNASFRPKLIFGRILFIDTGRHRMNLPDAPIAHPRLLRHAFPHPEGPGKIEGLLRPNSWRESSGGGPTPDKPEVILETPSDLNRVNSFLNLRVADIWACYKRWGDKGAFFLTEPLDNHGWEWRCYMRDPDGYLIEVGQYTQMALDRFENHAS
jgi:hypothetical protein